MPLKILPEKSSIKKIIAIAAGKGGVGKSTIAVYLARALKTKGLKVGLVDADLYGPSLRKMLPEENMPVKSNHSIIPAICNGIKLISMAFFKNEEEATILRAPMVNSIISQFLKQVDWGELDYLIVDFPPGTGDIQLTMAQKVHFNGAIIVTTPQEMALIDVHKTIQFFQKVEVPLIGIIENMSSYFHPTTKESIYFFGRGGGEKLSSQYRAPLLGKIPLDPQICTRADLGQSLFDFEKDHQIVKIFEDIAQQLTSGLKKEPGHNISDFSLNKNYTITLEWSDGTIKELPFSLIQKNCPCADCKEKGPVSVKEDVTIYQVHKIGQYALQFSFSSGCKHGIYSHQFLRSL